MVEFAQGNEGNKLALATPSLSVTINDLFWQRCVFASHISFSHRTSGPVRVRPPLVLSRQSRNCGRSARSCPSLNQARQGQVCVTPGRGRAFVNLILWPLASPRAYVSQGVTAPTCRHHPSKFERFRNQHRGPWPWVCEEGCVQCRGNTQITSIVRKGQMIETLAINLEAGNGKSCSSLAVGTNLKKNKGDSSKRSFQFEEFVLRGTKMEEASTQVAFRGNRACILDVRCHYDVSLPVSQHKRGLIRPACYPFEPRCWSEGLMAAATIPAIRWRRRFSGGSAEHPRPA